MNIQFLLLKGYHIRFLVAVFIIAMAAVFYAVPPLSAQQAGGNCTIYITSRPSGADIYIDNVPTDLQTPAMISGLTPGEHLIQLERGDYVAEKTVILEEGVFTRNELILRLPPVKLTFKSQPDSAMVILGSREIGSTPLAFELDDPGTFTIRFYKEHYIPLDTVIYFAERKAYRVSAELERSAFLMISSHPSGADIFIDRDFKGNTPLEAEISAGEHGLQIMLGDYQIYQRMISLHPGDSVEIAAELEKLKGRLTVQGLPDGAAIYLNGGYFGNAPLESAPLEVGEYEVTFSKPGYLPLKEPVKAVIVQDLETTIQLAPERKTALKGVLRSAVFPGLGQIYVEREFKGYLYTVSEIGLITATAASIILYNQAAVNYNSARYEYILQIEENEIIRTRRNMNDRYDEVTRYKDMRDGFIMLAAGFWLWNMLDVYIWNEPPKTAAFPISGRIESGEYCLFLKISWDF